jgi:hypothetical protein
MSYDPDPRRRRKGRKRRVPPQLRAWVYGRRRYDPARRKHRIRGKPYGVGKRGGVYWSGGHKPRYDPDRKRFKARAKGFFGKIGSKLEQYAEIIGFGVGFGVPTYLAKQKQPTKPWLPWLIDGIKDQTECLFGGGGFKSTTDYLLYKFTNPESHWTAPFWGSVIGRTLSGFGFFGIVPARWNKLLKKLFTGSLIASIIGGLFMLGTPDNGTPQTTTTSTRTNLQYYG